MSKASTRTKGKFSSEAPQEDEKRALSEAPEEKEKKDKKEKEETRKPFESAALSSAEEPNAVSSAVLSALKYVDGYDNDDDQKAKATSKAKRAPFVVSEAKEDIETGSRSSKEATSGPPNTKARNTTNVDSFRRRFDRDERPSAGAMVAATAPLALQAAPLALRAPIPAHQHDTSDEVTSLQSPSRVSKSEQSSSSKTASKASTRTK
jgi:hypothetical protein